MEIQVKLSNGAILPTKAHPEDTGYDLALISIIKDMTLDRDTSDGASYAVKHERIYMFDTGVAVKPPPGYYIDIVPRSSFSKTGYHFANSVGIIDSNYRGTIRVVIKGDETLAMRPLPWVCFQMILRKREDASIRQVASLDDTDRGAGGFGSTSLPTDVPEEEPLGC